MDFLNRWRPFVWTSKSIFKNKIGWLWQVSNWCLLIYHYIPHLRLAFSTKNRTCPETEDRIRKWNNKRVLKAGIVSFPMVYFYGEVCGICMPKQSLTVVRDNYKARTYQSCSILIRLRLRYATSYEIKIIYNNFKIKIFLFFAVYLIPALCSFRASILIHKSRLSQKRKILNLNCREFLLRYEIWISIDYHQLLEQLKKQNMTLFMVITLQVGGIHTIVRSTNCY